jgi:hypothetical protein
MRLGSAYHYLGGSFTRNGKHDFVLGFGIKHLRGFVAAVSR